MENKEIIKAKLIEGVKITVIRLLKVFQSGSSKEFELTKALI